MQIFKAPTASDSYGRYVWDSAHADFWATKNWKGRILMSPMFLLVLLVALPLRLIGNIDKDKP